MTATASRASSTGRVLELDPAAFACAFGRAPFGVRHNLADHPLLTLDAIAALAERFPGRIERHRADLPQVHPGEAPELEISAVDMVRGIETNGCWMVFWYLEQDPEYKALLDRTLDEAQAYLPPGTGPAIQREAFLFLSAPDAVTPVHFDPEHNFLLQVKGHKDMNVCRFPSREVELRELDRYHDHGSRNLEGMPAEGELFGLDPGLGVYVPSFMPHWVKNGPQASISLSITFRTRASRQAERIHYLNSRMRRLHLSPTPPGESPKLDRAKESMWLTLTGSKRGLSALRMELERRRAHRRPA